MLYLKLLVNKYTFGENDLKTQFDGQALKCM